MPDVLLDPNSYVAHPLRWRRLIAIRARKLQASLDSLKTTGCLYIADRLYSCPQGVARESG
jgi:hypothetical protein